MAFSIKTREEKTAKIDFGLVDPALLQDLQDHFCDAHNLYLACLSKKHGVITKAHGSREELSYIHAKVDMDMHVTLLNRLINSNLESVVEMNCNRKFIKMCGVTVRLNGDIMAIWIVIGLLEGTDEKIPSYMKTTTEEHFYKSIEFLETISKQLFAVKQKEHLAHEAFIASRASESRMEEELRRNGVLTSIVKMLEAENEFTKIVDDILKDVGDYLHLSNCALLRESADGELVDMICEYAETEEASVMERSQNLKKADLPFFNGKPYMISSNSMMSEKFRVFFERAKFRAGVFLPITINDKAGMYLVFWEKKQNRIWDVNDIKFLNDVKRIVQSILNRYTAKNSLASSYASLEAIFENVGCGIYVRDPKAEQVLYTNKQYTTVFSEVFAVQSVDVYISQVIDTGEQYQEFYFENNEKWLAFQCTRITWVDGREVELCAIFDVSAKRFYQKKAEKQESHDLLTGLYNRIRCEHDLEAYVEYAIEAEQKGAILYIDLDDFKHINDGLGYQYGDVLLQSIAEQLLKIPCVEDNCYRVGGDEFLIIVQHRHYSMLYEIIDEIKELFAKPWFLKGTEYYCTMSMSVVRFPDEGERFDELIKKADAALFNAKNAGKNRVFFYDENHDIGSYKRLDFEKKMRNATKSHIEEFEVFYQPIVDATSEGIPCIGAEALVRWNSAELGYVEYAIEAEQKGAILYIDLDDFKHINDGLGYQYGDVLLQSIAEQLLKIPCVEDNCYRVGGDEFLIIVQHRHYSMLYEIIDEIKELFAKPWFLKGTEYYCTMSMSVVRFPDEGERFDELIKKADAALFNAKNAGKNRVFFYDENHDIGSYKRLDFEKKMRNATKSHIEEFEVFYQPIVDATSEGIPCIGAEALVRWNSAELGYVSPGDFIPLAEYLGLINPIGMHVLREACKRCKYWNDMGQPDFFVNVNLSVVQLLQADIVEQITKVVEETGIIPEHLHLEVTEGLAINDMERMKQILADIKKLGVKVALDDFGTGYSSLNHIREMPIDIIKIDRCFIENIEKDDFAKSFVKMVTELANVIGVRTCIEGVELAEQVEILRKLNVHMIQGYFFGKPMPVAEFEENYL